MRYNCDKLIWLKYFWRKTQKLTMILVCFFCFMLKPHTYYLIPIAGVESPLMIASDIGDAYMVDLLIRYGANIEHTRADGHRAITLAVCEGHAEVVRVLLENGSK